MEYIAGIVDDVSTDDDYYHSIGKAEKVYGTADRMEAKVEGHKAAVRIAKARALKKKKEPVTKLATRLSTAASKLRRRGQRKVYIAALNSDYSTESKTAERSRTSATAKHKLRVLEPENPAVQREAVLKRRAEKLESASHSVARKSGGLATAMKRNAEAGIEHIVRGRAAKTAARAAGVLGIVSLFASHLSGKTKKNQRG